MRVNTGTEMERKKEVGDSSTSLAAPFSCSIHPLPSSSLLSLRRREGGHPVLQALNQPAGDLACPEYSACSLCSSACYAAILLPFVCSWCQVTPPWAQRCHSSYMPFFPLPTLCQNSMADSSVLHQYNLIKTSL